MIYYRGAPCADAIFLKIADIFPLKWATPPVRLGLSGRNSGKTPETLSERFLEFPSRVRLGCPKPYNSRHLRLPEHFQNSLPPQYGWGRLFFQNWFQRGPLRAGHGIPSSTGGIPDQRRVCGVVHLGGVVETLRRSNSLSRSVFSTAGSYPACLA